jgi:serine/threonine protein kinase
MVHKSGYIYGDLKLDNILAGCGETIPDGPTDNAFSNVSLNLIDFGFATKYLDSKGSHLPDKHIELFQGNLIFSSVSQLKFRSTSRRDDLISLAYMISYLLHEGHLLGFDPETPQKQMECYNDLLSRKTKASVDDLCGNHQFLLPFFEEIF